MTEAVHRYESKIISFSLLRAMILQIIIKKKEKKMIVFTFLSAHLKGKELTVCC